MKGRYDCVGTRWQDEGVIDHFGINCADWDKSKAFYDNVLGVLGYTRQMDFEVAIGYGKDGKPDFWIADMSAGDAAAEPREPRRVPGQRHLRRSSLLRRRDRAGRRIAARAAALAAESP